MLWLLPRLECSVVYLYLYRNETGTLRIGSLALLRSTLDFFFLFAVWPRGLGQGWARQKLSRLDVRAILGYRARDLSHGAYSVQRVHSERLQTGS